MKTKRLIVALIGMLMCASCAPSVPLPPTPDVNAIRTSAAYTVVAEFTLTAAAFTPASAAPLPTETQTFVPANTTTPPTAQATVVVEGTGTVPAGPTVAGPTATGVICDQFTFVSDVNYPDGTTVTPAQEFTKTWKIKNTGSCTWGQGYGLIYAGYYDQMGGQASPLSTVVQPGDEIEVSVQFKAPQKLGEYVSGWTMQNAQGRPFHDEKGKPFYIQIIVK